MLTFDLVSDINRRRSQRWHPGGLNSWSLSDWGVAMAGEAGEACNVIKKLNRLRDQLANRNANESRLLDSRGKALLALGVECADTYLYLDLLCQSAGIVLIDRVVDKFNLTSIEYGFPERLPTREAA